MILDAHTHILPQIDDGAASPEESLLMTQAVSCDCDVVFLTPHFYPHEQSLDDFLLKRAHAEKLFSSLSLPDNLKTVVGCEVYLSPLLLKNDDLAGICIGKSRYALVEMPFIKTWNEKLFEIIDVLLYEQKIVPIFAHVERYPFFRKNPAVLNALVRKGCLAQLNAEALLSSFWEREFPIKLIQKTQAVHLLGSDCQQ
jgi:protein-tyrosine phosphatase